MNFIKKEKRKPDLKNGQNLSKKPIISMDMHEKFP